MHTRMVFHRDVFKRTCFTQIVFSKLRCFYTEMLSHRGAYTYGNVFTHKYFYTEMILHWGTLNTHTQMPLQKRNFTTALNERDAFHAKGLGAHKQNHNFVIFPFELHLVQERKTMQTQETARRAAQNHRNSNIAISLQFLLLETHFVGKVWPSANPNCNVTSILEYRHFVREGCVSSTSSHAVLPPKKAM